MPALIFCVALCGLCAKPLLAATLPTTTVLVASPSSVAAQKPVTLTATVMAGSAPATPGQVVFCVATATFCEDLNILGTAQVTRNGTATIKVLLGLGRHDIYAKFKGTTSYAGSTSLPAIETVEVTGHLPSVATVSTSGSAGNFTLTSAVAAYGIVPPTGTVSFNDATTLTTVAMAVLDSTAFSVGFTPATLYSIGLGFGIFDVKTIAVGDFNGDGYLDVAIANPDISGVTVLLGDPDHPGQFTAPRNYPAGLDPTSVAVADFRGNGILDLVVANVGDNNVGILPGDPAHPGKFLPQYTVTAGVYPYSVVVGDFNGDGLPDIATANDYGPNRVSLLMNNAGSPGNFLPAVGYFPDSGFEQPALAVGDFNSDGLPDLAVTQDFGGVGILLNNPASPGQMTFGGSYGNRQSLSVTVGDFNGDGIPDLAFVAETFETEVLEVALGDPAHPGQFLGSQVYPVVSYAYGSAVATGDFNGDSILDLAVPYASGLGATFVNGVGILQGDPANPGQFLPENAYSLLGSFSLSLATGDFDGDGLSDVVTTNSDYSYTSSEQTSVGVQLAALTATAAAPHLTLINPTFIYAAYSGDENYSANNSCVISLPAPSQDAGPIIAALAVSNVTQTSATISWDSNVPTYGQVSYGTTAAFGSTTPWPFRVSPKHSFVLTNLAPGTKYDFAVSSIAYFSGCQHWTTTSPTASFTTLAAN